MKRNHILFLSHYFPPEVNAPANRTYEHAKVWVKSADVTVITNFPNHPDGKIFPGYKNSLIQKEIVDGINVVRVWTFITPNEGFILRTLNYLIYMISAILYVLFSRIKFSIVMATTPQFFCAVAGWVISKVCRKPFILELRDLWPESIIAVGALKNRTVIYLLGKIELALYRSADRIISVTRSFKHNLITRGIEADKIHVVFNGVSIDMFSQATCKDEPVEMNQEIREFVCGGFIVGYIGTIGMAHSVITLIDAAEKLKNKGVKFLIVGSGAERQLLENEIKNRNLNNVKIFPIQSKSQIPAIIDSLHLFVVHLKNNPLFRTVIPSKIFEGMIMRKPILIGVNGEAREIIESAGCGTFFEPENADELAQSILGYLNNPAVALQQGENGHNYVLNNFDRNKQALSLYRMITEVVEKNMHSKPVLKTKKAVVS